MRRRDFLGALGGAAAAWPLAARAQQQSAKLPIIGLLGAATASAWSPWTAAFVQRLYELGWVEGRTVAIEYRWAEGRSERYAEIAAEFVRLKIDGYDSGKRGPRTKAGDIGHPDRIRGRERPCRQRPRGEPCLVRVATLLDCRSRPPNLPANGSNCCVRFFPVSAGWRSWPTLTIPAVLEMDEMQAATRTLGLEVTRLEIRRAEDIAPG